MTSEHTRNTQPRQTDNVSTPHFLQKLYWSLYRHTIGLWYKLRNSVTLGLFGASGATTFASVQHVIHSCSGGNCSGCGRCAVALLAAAAAASGGVAGRTKGQRRWRLIGLIVVVALLLYGALEAWKRGWFGLLN